jgi:hypothetical protein
VVEETHGDSNPMDVDDDPAFFEASQETGFISH